MRRAATIVRRTLKSFYDESIRVAGSWLREQKLDAVLSTSPKVTRGDVVVHKTRELVQAKPPQSRSLARRRPAHAGLLRAAGVTEILADRLHPLIPRETPRFTALYRRRASVEREFGRLKHEWALAPLRVRGLDRVRLHADLTILAKLACALSRTQAVPLAA